MRVLFTFIGGIGHFHPLVPVARAAVAAGHEVAVAGSGKLTAVVEAAGFRAFPTSAPRTADEPPPVRDLTPLLPTDALAAKFEFAENFATKGARRHATALQDHLREWRPDVVVRDEADLGSAIAAEVLGVPAATVLVLAAGTLSAPISSRRLSRWCAPSTGCLRTPTSPCSPAGSCSHRSHPRSGARPRRCRCPRRRSRSDPTTASPPPGERRGRGCT